MKKYTGSITLGIIALIFLVDTVLSLGEGATISEWFHNFLKDDPMAGFTIMIGVFATLMVHFWRFDKFK